MGALAASLAHAARTRTAHSHSPANPVRPRMRRAQAILDHPAWNNKASGAKSIDERAREGAKDTLKF